MGYIEKKCNVKCSNKIVFESSKEIIDSRKMHRFEMLNT